MEFLHTGVGFHDFALFLNRMVLGAFFFLARFRWAYDPSSTDLEEHWDSRGYTFQKKRRWFTDTRRHKLNDKMVHCGVKHATLLGPIVAVTEILAATALIVGLLTPLAALGLLVITLRATCCTAHEKTMKQNPVDKIDVVSCYLWTPEPVYVVLCVIAVAFGAGAWSLDAALLSFLR